MQFSCPPCWPSCRHDPDLIRSPGYQWSSWRYVVQLPWLWCVSMEIRRMTHVCDKDKGGANKDKGSILLSKSSIISLSLLWLTQLLSVFVYNTSLCWFHRSGKSLPSSPNSFMVDFSCLIESLAKFPLNPNYVLSFS